MSRSWKLKPDLWSRVSPLFECFTPSEAQQCEQNTRKSVLRPSGGNDISTTSAVLSMLPCAQFEGACSADMHGAIAETMLNSSYMASVLFVIFENYKRKIVAQHQSERVDSDDQDSTTESVLLSRAN